MELFAFAVKEAEKLGMHVWIIMMTGGRPAAARDGRQKQEKI